MTTWNTALITGASSGIGADLAEQLAADGSNVILVARSADVLEATASRMRDQHGVEVEVLPADLLDPAGVAKVAARLRDTTRPVELLVNNAGYGFQDAFDEIPLDRNLGMIDLNVRALVELSHAAIPAMRSRGRGGILNVTSVAAFAPVPFMSIYGATKAFVQSFSEGLHEELRGTGIHVTALAPGFTRTNFQSAGEVDETGAPGFLWMESGPVAAAGLAGVAKNKASVLPGINRGTDKFAALLPNSLTSRLTSKLMNR